MKRYQSLGLLLAVTAAGCAGSSRSTLPEPDPLAAGRKLYVAKCAKCHKLYDPNRYSDEAWRGWMRKMSRKARLKPAQEQWVTRYVDMLRTANPRGNATEPAPGR